MEQQSCLPLFQLLSKGIAMDNNFMNFRLKLIFLALCILVLLAIKGHIRLGYAPELEKKSIAIAFDYYGAFEKEVEGLVSRLEEAYMELDGIKNIHSVSEPGKGYILCMFSDKARLDEAYVQLSDITSNVWSDFPDGVNRPSITRSSRDTYPVYISYFPQAKEGISDLVKKAYEAVLGVGTVELGGQKKKELMVDLKPGWLSGDTLGNRLRSSNLVRKVNIPGGQTLVLSSRLSSAADFGQVQMTPGLKLSDMADIKYQEAESQSLGHINGQSMLLFFIMKSGEGNTVRLCRELEKVTSQFGGSQLFSLGNKIEKSFIGSSSMLLILFIFLLFDLWFKVRSYHLVAQATCRCIGSLLAAIAAVTAAGYQLDITVMAALFLVVVFSFMGCIHNREDNYKLIMTKDELDKSRQLEDYFVLVQSVQDPSILKTLSLGVVNQELVDIIKDKTGIDISGLEHTLSGADFRHDFNKHFNEKNENNIPLTINDIKLLPYILNHANETFKKANVNKVGHIKIRFEYYDKNKGVIVVENSVVKPTKKNKPRMIVKTIFRAQNSRMEVSSTTISSVRSRNNLNITPYSRNVNFILILSTLIIALYAPIHFKDLVLPCCTALTVGCCVSALFLYVKKKIILPQFRIPLWCFSPILLFILSLVPFSPISPYSTDVNFSLEYESGTSFTFIQQSALEVEAALLKWNAFDCLTLHIDQGRAAFTILGGKKNKIMAKIGELSSFYPEIFFYIPEKHTRHSIDVTVYGNDVSEIENNVLQLAKYVNKYANNVNIIYNFKSDLTNIVLEIPVKCVAAGLYPYDVYKTLYYTASEPVVDKYFAGDVETDVKIRGDARYRKTLAGLLSVPVLSPFCMAGAAGDYIKVRRESAQGRIYHKNRMRVMSFSVTGISRSKLREIVSKFPFTGSCHGEVG